MIKQILERIGVYHPLIEVALYFVVISIIALIGLKCGEVLGKVLYYYLK